MRYTWQRHLVLSGVGSCQVKCTLKSTKTSIVLLGVCLLECYSVKILTVTTMYTAVQRCSRELVSLTGKVIGIRNYTTTLVHLAATAAALHLHQLLNRSHLPNPTLEASCHLCISTSGDDKCGQATEPHMSGENPSPPTICLLVWKFCGRK